MQILGSVFHSNLHGQCWSFPKLTFHGWKPEVYRKKNLRVNWKSGKGGTISLQVRNLAGKPALGQAFSLSLRCSWAVGGPTWAGILLFWDPTDCSGLSTTQTVPGSLGWFAGRGTRSRRGMGRSIPGFGSLFSTEGWGNEEREQQPGKELLTQVKGSGGQNCHGHSSVGSKTWLCNILMPFGAT